MANPLHHRPDRPRQTGFTLLELLVVMTAMGLILLLAMPATMFRTPGAHRTAVQGIVGALREARTLAIRSGTPAAFTLDQEGRTYRVDPGGRQAALPDDLSLTLLTAEGEVGRGRGSIRFFPTGQSTGGGLRAATNAGPVSVRVEWLTGHVDSTWGEGGDAPR